ncbi:MAG: hypothetical protein GY698_19060 [Actinomycetia bacterium]|nr:hypothetical protein [Actinomycetes bacterium]
MTLGFRAELHIAGQLHLRARDLVVGLGAFATRDPLDGRRASTVEAQFYSYADNDPIQLVDPTGGRATDCAGPYADTTLVSSLQSSAIFPAVVESLSSKGCDPSASIAWLYMSDMLAEFQEDISRKCWKVIFCSQVDPLTVPGLFAGRSTPDNDFDPKPRIRQYFDRAKTSSALTFYELSDLGDPDFLYFFDVLGNAIWGLIAPQYLGGGDVSETATIFGIRTLSALTGAWDPGDDLAVSIGFELYRKYGDDATLQHVVEALREARSEFLRVRPFVELTLARRFKNKLVWRTDVDDAWARVSSGTTG